MRWLACVAVLAFVALAVPAAGQYYMELQGPGRDPWPADCSTWHELYPNFCLIHHQDSYTDNGDGVLSACDYIVLDGVSYHVDWVGPTYIMGGTYWEPIDPPGGNPICQTWHQVHPQYCAYGHVDDWEDSDGTGDASVCDMVWIGGVAYHIDAVQLNIQISAGSPVERSTWGRVKGLFSIF